MNSPIIPICVCWLAGLIVGGFTQPGGAQPWVALAALASSGWLASRIAGGRPWGAVPGLCLASLAAGLAAAPAARGHERDPPELRRGLAVIEGHVVSVRHGAQEARSTVVVERGYFATDRTPVPPGTRVTVSPYPLDSGGRVRVLVALQPITPFRNPSPHPAWPSGMRADAFGRVASPGGIETLSQPAWAGLLDSARAHVRDALLRSLPEQHAGLARALVLGEGAAVEDADRDAIRRAGLAHVLAVSGLHVAIIAGLIVAMLRRLLLRLPPLATRFDPRRIACALGVPLALSLSLFAGGSPSALRAGVTAALGWCVIAGGRHPAPVSVAAGAVVLVTGAEPTLAMRPGMLLSIAATAAILSTGSEGITSSFRQLATLSTRTMVATAPLVLWCFGAVALPGLLANLVLLPVASALLIPLAATHGVLASLETLPALWSGPAFGLVADAFVAGCRLFAQLDSGHPWPPPSVPQGIVLGGWAIGALWTRGVAARVSVTAAAVLLLGCAEYALVRSEQPRGVLRVTFVDVGQGDAALVDLPDGRLMLIDAGGVIGRGRDPGEHALLPLLRARRRDRIDIAVLSHPHPDHYGGLRALMRNVSIGELWDSGQAEPEVNLSPTAAEAAQLLKEARGRGTRVRGPADLCQHPMRSGEARIQVVWPCPGYDSGFDANDNSLVVRIDFGRRRMLFAGDAEAAAEAQMVQRGVSVGADVLKVGHHGSRTSSGEAFVDAVRPRLAVISAGAHNRFGHPHAEIPVRLRRHGAHVIELGHSGGTVVLTDGEALTAETWRGELWVDGPPRAQKNTPPTASRAPPGDATAMGWATTR